MTNIREKLIELLAQVQDSGTIVIPAGHGDRYEWVSNQKVTDHLIANGVTIQKWIPVTERLPELHGDFITAIAFEDGDILIDISVWYGKCWETLSGEKCNVTHWMPLPEPPKEVE